METTLKQQNSAGGGEEGNRNYKGQVIGSTRRENKRDSQKGYQQRKGQTMENNNMVSNDSNMQSNNNINSNHNISIISNCLVPIIILPTHKNQCQYCQYCQRALLTTHHRGVQYQSYQQKYSNNNISNNINSTINSNNIVKNSINNNDNSSINDMTQNQILPYEYSHLMRDKAQQGNQAMSPVKVRKVQLNNNNNINNSNTNNNININSISNNNSQINTINNNNNSIIPHSNIMQTFMIDPTKNSSTNIIINHNTINNNNTTNNNVLPNTNNTINNNNNDNEAMTFQGQTFILDLFTKQKKQQRIYLDKLMIRPQQDDQHSVQPPKKKHQHSMKESISFIQVFIFDWDDTILCTSYLSSFKFSQITTDSRALLNKLDQSSVKLLNKTIQTGADIYIITNAAIGWVEHSSSQYLPQTHTLIMAHKQTPKFRIISARSQFGDKFPGETARWKIQAFKVILENRSRSLLTNLICLGDSNLQIEAAHSLNKQFQHSLIKTIKLRQNPKPNQLIEQQQLVTQHLAVITNTTKNLTVRLEKKKK